METKQYVNQSILGDGRIIEIAKSQPSRFGEDKGSEARFLRSNDRTPHSRKPDLFRKANIEFVSVCETASFFVLP